MKSKSHNPLSTDLFIAANFHSCFKTYRSFSFIFFLLKDTTKIPQKYFLFPKHIFHAIRYDTWEKVLLSRKLKSVFIYFLANTRYCNKREKKTLKKKRKMIVQKNLPRSIIIFIHWKISSVVEKEAEKKEHKIFLLSPPEMLFEDFVIFSL